MVMPTFNVEVVHEPTGTYMNFTTEIEPFDDEDIIDEDNAWNTIMDELSIICEKVED